MKKSVMYGLWGGLFIVCAGLGFIQTENTAARAALWLVTLLFFAVPGWLIYESGKQKDAHTLLLVRNLCGLSLIATTIALILNFLFAVASPALGNVLHTILVIVSTPMFCCGHWVAGMFFWACLLVSAQKLLKQK